MGRGKGKFYGDKITGNFINGARQGYGTYYFRDGRKNIGEFKNGQEWNAKNYNIYGRYNGKWVNGVLQN